MNKTPRYGYICTWKICSRPLKQNKNPKEVELTDAEKTKKILRKMIALMKALESMKKIWNILFKRELTVLIAKSWNQLYKPLKPVCMTDFWQIYWITYLTQITVNLYPSKNSTYSLCVYIFFIRCSTIKVLLKCYTATVFHFECHTPQLVGFNLFIIHFFSHDNS